MVRVIHPAEGGSLLKQALLAALIATSILVPLEAHADHRPNSYCSDTGDLCQTTKKVDGTRKLTIGTAAKYFGRFKLCVTAPDGSHGCKKFRMRKEGTIYARSVSWSANFPNKGKGAYTVRWRAVEGDGQYGKRLGFHL
jgi:hypothetical protein